MKLDTLLEASPEYFFDENEIWNYILYNAITATYARAHWFTKEFQEYLAGPGKDQKLQAIEFLKSSDKAYNDIKFQIKDDLRHIKIAGDTVSFDGYGYSIYCYDQLGKPPFKFADEEFNTFAIYKNCDTLTEIPDWIPPHIWGFQIGHANISSLKGIDKIIKRCGQMTFTDTPIKSHVLGIAKIEGIDNVGFDFNKELTNIMNQHIHDPDPNGSDNFKIDLLELQSDLIDAGFSEYAKL